MDELKLWAVDASGNVKEVDPESETKTESMLEEANQACEMMKRNSDDFYAKKSGMTFHRHAPHLDLARGTASARSCFALDLRTEESLVTFFPAAVHLCQEEFTKADEDMDFPRQPPSYRRPATETVQEQWSVVLNADGWNRNRDQLQRLCESVAAAWTAARDAQPREAATQ